MYFKNLRFYIYYQAVCNSVKFTKKNFKSKILYYTLFVYLVVPMRRVWQYLDLGILGGNQLTLIYDNWPEPCSFGNVDY